ncbi:MAG: tetratricopeptide repeat protein, partial [Planctomycetes bacterium]|nr:tetratricopeptide repeat protein [Planctomycetota bacterium]
MIVVENLNMLLSDQMNDDDAWALRKILQHEDRVMLLATAIRRFEEVENYDKAMFELFRMMELKPLDLGECAVLWESVTGQAMSERRIRPIQILTGGNPRLITIISGFAAKLSFKELMQDLIRLVDEHTEYFKTHLDKLAPTERKAYLALAELWDPSTAREVAGAARLGVSKTSSLLARLEDKGAVAVVDKKGRTKQYQVAERMYNIYYLMRRRGAPSRRVRAVVNFIVNFYEERDLLKITRSIAEEACKIGPDGRLEHLHACECILNGVSSPQFREEFVRGVPESFFQMPDIPPFLKELKEDNQIEPVKSAQEQGELKGLLEQIDSLIKDPDKLDKAEEVCRLAMKLSPENAQLWVRFGSIRERAGAYGEAEEAYCKAVEVNPEDAWAWSCLGEVLDEHLERYEEAEKAYRKAIEVDPAYAAWAWAHLGRLLETHLERYEEAEKAYRKATQIEPKVGWGWAQLGQLLGTHLERYEEAEEMYRKAVEIDPVYAWAWAHLGQLLETHLERYEEAEKAYTKVTEVKSEAKWGWALLGQLLETHLERYDEAEQMYRKAIKIDPAYAQIWARLGHVLTEYLKRHDEAVVAYGEFVELEPDVAEVWCAIGQLSADFLHKYVDAETAYRRAVALKPDYCMAWALLGRVLSRDMGRSDEAEAACRKAIAIEPESLHGLRGLITLRLQREGQSMEALELAEDFVSGHPGNAFALNCFAWVFYKHGKYDMLEYAEAWGHKAVELDCDNGSYQHTLGCVLAARGKGEDSLVCARKYLGDRDTVEKTLDDAIELFVELAAGGYGVEGLKVLRESGCADLLEPLVVGVALYVGEDVKVAAEIMEVGKDVAERIKERCKKRAREEG